MGGAKCGLRRRNAPKSPKTRFAPLAPRLGTAAPRSTMRGLATSYS